MSLKSFGRIDIDIDKIVAVEQDPGESGLTYPSIVVYLPGHSIEMFGKAGEPGEPYRQFRAWLIEKHEAIHRED